MFWLRYKNAGDSTWTQTQFVGLDNRPTKTADRIAGTTLRSNLYSHIRSIRGKRTVRIGADEAIAAYDFLEAFFCAHRMQYSTLATPNASTDSDGTEVMQDGGDLPITYLEDITVLTEFTFTLNNVEPD